MSVFQRLVRVLGVGVLALSSTGAMADSNSDALAAELESVSIPSFMLGSHTLAQVLPAIQTLRTEGNLGKTSCVESAIKENSKRIVTTHDAQGKLCKIYDLSFPVLFRAGKREVVGELPLEAPGINATRAWLHGNEQVAASEMSRSSENLSPDVLKGTWFGALPFRQDRPLFLDGDLSFRLSDVLLERPFSLAEADLKGLKELLASGQTGGKGLREMVESPSSLLEKIEFRWNPGSKVFEIVADLDFLPLTAPLALVDYQIQYKYVVEKLIRSAILNVLNRAAALISNPAARGLVEVALQDTFEFVELAYEYQMNRLENTLELNLSGRIPAEISKSDVEKGLNILFAERSDLLSQYVLARVLQQKFDLDALDQVGKSLRYASDKSRESTRASLHSELVLKKGCSTEIRERYFAVCDTPQQKRFLFSLMSKTSILGRDLGPALLHHFGNPQGIKLRRSIAWQLSAALRVAPLGIPPKLNAKLVSIAKDFAKSGAMDEAYLLNPVAELKLGDDFSAYMSESLRKQALVPFGFATSEGEAGMVDSARLSLEDGLRE